MSEVWIFCSFDSAHHIVAVPACIKKLKKWVCINVLSRLAQPDIT